MTSAVEGFTHKVYTYSFLLEANSLYMFKTNTLILTWISVQTDPGYNTTIYSEFNKKENILLSKQFNVFGHK